MQSDILDQIKPKGVNTTPNPTQSDTPTKKIVEEQEIDEIIETLYTEEVLYPHWILGLSCGIAFDAYEKMTSTRLERIQNIYQDLLFDVYKKILSATDDEFITIKGKVDYIQDIKIHQSMVIIKDYEPLIPLYKIDPYEIKVIDVDGNIRELEYNMKYVKGILYLKEIENIGTCYKCPFLNCKQRKDKH